MLKVKLLVQGVDQATDEDLAEMRRFLRRQGLQISTKARPKKGKTHKTYKALMECALPVTPVYQTPSNDPTADGPRTPEAQQFAQDHLGETTEPVTESLPMTSGSPDEVSQADPADIDRATETYEQSKN